MVKLEINIDDEYYKEIKESKFYLQDHYLVKLIKEGKIIKDETDNFVEVGSLRAGTTIEVCGIQMEILDNTYIGKERKRGVFCLTKDILFEKPFDEEKNNWEKSSLRKYLNTKYKESLDKKLIDALIPFSRYLLTDDGMRNYGEECGTCVDMISLISCDEYREYREYISDKSDWWWTLTAWSAKPSNSTDVQIVHPDGCFYHNYAYIDSFGVSPVFLLQPSLKVKNIDNKKKKWKIKNKIIQ